MPRRSDERLPRSVASRARDAWLALRGDALLAMLVALHVAVVWSVPRFPTQDGPSHLHNADVLLRYAQPDGEIFREYYEINPSPSPNWLGHLALAALLAVSSPATAERIFLSLYAIALPLALRYALGALGRDATRAALLAIPFVFGWLLHLGFYNFSIGVALWCFAAGYWLRRGGLARPREIGIFTLLALLIHFSNAIALALLVAFVLIDAAWLSFLARRPARTGGDEGGRWREKDWRSRFAAPAAALAPALAAFALYQKDQSVGRIRWAPAADRVRDLAGFDLLVALRDSERWLAIAYAALFFTALTLALLARCRRAQLERRDGVWIAAALFAILAFAAPTEAGGAWLVHHRVGVFAALAMILAIGAAGIGRRAFVGLQIAAALVAAGFLAERGRATREIGAALAEYASAAPAVAHGSALLGLSFSHRGAGADGRPLSPRIAPFLHASALIASERGAVDLGNYEANATCFPLRFRDARNPFRLIGFQEGLEAEPPRADFIHYAERTGARVDFVILGGVGPEHDHDLRAKAIFKQIAMAYDQVYVTPGRGVAQVYRWRGDARGR